MAKYLILKHYRGGPAPTVDYPPADQWLPAEGDAHLQFMGDFLARLEESGEFVDEPGAEARGRIRPVRRGGSAAGDHGPFAETKDLIAGWCIVDVESWDRAVQLAGELSAAPGPGGRPFTNGWRFGR